MPKRRGPAGFGSEPPTDYQPRACGRFPLPADGDSTWEGLCPPSDAGPARPDGWSPIRSGRIRVRLIWSLALTRRARKRAKPCCFLETINSRPDAATYLVAVDRSRRGSTSSTREGMCNVTNGASGAAVSSCATFARHPCRQMSTPASPAPWSSPWTAAPPRPEKSRIAGCG